MIEFFKSLIKAIRDFGLCRGAHSGYQEFEMCPSCNPPLKPTRTEYITGNDGSKIKVNVYE